jgi:hypothetical protein
VQVGGAVKASRPASAIVAGASASLRASCDVASATFFDASTPPFEGAVDELEHPLTTTPATSTEAHRIPPLYPLPLPLRLPSLQSFALHA